jgi:hypothetical protein
MIERIFIPTVHRADNQITFNNLPDKYKNNVTMVVQAWERSQYTYDCDYLVLPDTPEYHFSDYYCLPKTRSLIYEAGKNMKYCMFDDDVQFYRRNAKYLGGESNMERSKRLCTEEDFNEMFDLFDVWLDLSAVTVCGCAQIENPPGGKFELLSNDRVASFRDNSHMYSAYWINGNDFSDILSELDLTSVRVGEDVCFLLGLLTRGYGNRVSNEFATHNHSNNKKIKSTVWDQQTDEQTLKDQKYLEKLFPDIYNILYDDNGKIMKGGYRNFGKSKIVWTKAFRESSSSLENFFND